MNRVYRGQIVHTKSFNEFEIFTDGFLVVSSNGKIKAIGNNFDGWKKQHEDFVNYDEIILTTSQFLMPGLIDCHIHASQFPQLGLGMDKPLLDWLNSYTFPGEAKFENEEYAAKVYKGVVKSTIQNGTTLASYYATNHKNSSVILAKEISEQGQRAFVGKVCSNCNCPDFYVEDTNSSLSETKKFVKEILNLNSDLVKPVITPRFALSCTDELQTELGQIAAKYNLNIQSHISENLEETKFVCEIFSKSYAEVYHDNGLLTGKTIMAHAVHLEDSEIELFKKTKAAIAHCPSSNINLSSGICDVKRFLKAGIKVGLGTDVGAGNSVSIKDAIMRCMDVSQTLKFIKTQHIQGTGKMINEDLSDYIPINYKQAIYLATLGGAESLSVEHITGNFECEKDFDALLIETNAYPINNFMERKGKSVEEWFLELIQKFIYVGDDRNILSVFVKGKQIK